MTRVRVNRPAPLPDRNGPTPGRLLQRSCDCGDHVDGPQCEDCRGDSEDVLQRRAAADATDRDIAPDSVARVLRSPGQPLTPNALAAMESTLGRDFSTVRVHADAAAAASAQDVHAHAYTVGNHIVFGAGRYAPGSAQGRRLLAHELTHVSQQAAASVSGGPLRIGARDSVAEQEADRCAAGVGAALAPAGRLIQRKDDESETVEPVPVSTEPVALMTLDTTTKEVGLHGASGLLYEGQLKFTDLTPGDYHLVPEPALRRWRIVNGRGGMRFDIVVRGIRDPFALPYARRVRLEIKTSPAVPDEYIDMTVDERISRISALAERTRVGTSEEDQLILLLEAVPLSQAEETVKRLNAIGPSGKSWFDRLDQVVDLGNNLKLHEALSKLRIKALGPDQGAKALTTAPILPWHDVMGFFETAATFGVERIPGDKVRIKYFGGTRLLGKNDFTPEFRKLPFNLFVGGEVFPLDQVLVIHDYDTGRYVPVVAHQLIGYQRAGIRKFLQDVATVAALVMPVSAAESAAARVAVYAFERVLPAALLVIDENRLNIVEWFPTWGPKMLRYADLVKVGVALYGIGRFAYSGWELFRGWRNVRAARASMEAGRTLDNEAAALARQLEADADRIIGQAEKVREAQQAAASGKSGGKGGAAELATPKPPGEGAPKPGPTEGAVPKAPPDATVPKAPPEGAAPKAPAEGPAPKAPAEPSGAASTKPGAAIIDSANRETKNMLRKRPELRNALEDSPLAANALKLCKSPCIPEFAQPQQVRMLESALTRAEQAQIPIATAKVKEFLHEAKDVRDLQRRLEYLIAGIDREIDIKGVQLAEIAERAAAAGRPKAAEGELGGGFDVREGNALNPRTRVTEPHEALRANLGNPPAANMHAHHIAPAKEGGPGMQWLRDALERAGIGINDKANGVFLSGGNRAASPYGTIPHTTYLHAGVRKDYLFTLTKRLQGKEGGALRAEMAQIKRELSTGNFLFEAAPSRWNPGDPIPVSRTPR